MIRYEQDGKYAYFNGLKFTRDDKTSYYLNSTIRKRLHRYVWEYHNGEIPKNCQIHHKDHDKSNNDIGNLCILKRGKHAALHGIIKTTDEEWLEWARNNLDEKARHKAAEWHKSKEGRKWHKKHYDKMKDKLYVIKEYVCENCGAEFETYKGNNRFCSNKCKSAWRRKSGIDNEVRVCEYCRNEYTVNKYSKQKCCSKPCSNRLIPRLPQLRKD